MSASNLRLIVLAMLILCHGTAAAEQLTIGVFAFRDKASTAKQWQPLADYLNRTLPGHQFVLQTYTYGELETAIEQRQVDFVLSHAAHYVMISERNALSSPLATMIDREGDQPMPVYGGSIVVRSDRSDISTLADLKGKTVATSSMQGFASYQMQAYELYKIGLEIPGDVKVIEVDLPIDRAVMAVLEGRADAAFARMGLVEQMVREGKLDPAKIKIVNSQHLAGFGYAFSTTLYPLWPFVAMPQVSDSLSARVAAALLTLPHDGEVARAAHIWGFTIPANYAPVKEVMQALRVPPFDETPEFSWRDVWQRYTGTILAACAAVAIILLLLFWLALSRRRFKAERQKVLEASLYARSLIEASLDPLVTISREGKITDVNRATELATGVDRGQLIGSDFSDFFIEPERARAGYQEAFSKGTVRDYPLAIRHVSGRVADVLYNASVYRDGSGTVQGVFAAARDVTLRKRLEEALRRLNEELERRVAEEVAENRAKDHLLIQQARLAAMGEMVHNIAHQWRQPLNALSIILANIKDAYDYQDLTAEFMNSSIAHSHRLLQRMSTTIDDFRDFFRPDREPGVFDVSRAVEDALFIMEASLKNNQCDVVKDIPRGMVAYGFSNQFSQVVLNVIANAKDALQERRVANGRIELCLYREGNRGILTVHDNAGGIPAGVLPKIFDPYFTTKEKGSGIGLYMSKMILERNLKGTIQAANLEGGAMIRMSLPLWREDQAAGS